VDQIVFPTLQQLVVDHQKPLFQNFAGRDSFNSIGNLLLAYLNYEGVRAAKYLPDQDRKKLQRPNSEFFQYTPHKSQYTSQPIALTFARHSKEFRSLTIQPDLCDSNDKRVGRKRESFQLFFHSSEQIVV